MYIKIYQFLGLLEYLKAKSIIEWSFLVWDIDGVGDIKRNVNTAPVFETGSKNL